MMPPPRHPCRWLLRLLSLVSLLGLVSATTACRTKPKYQTLANGLASPVDIGINDDGQHFYILNADFDRTYNTGSILVTDTNGSPLNYQYVPRMGRTLTVAGNVMMVTTDYENVDSSSEPHVLLFDISDPVNPTLKLDVTLDCSPTGTAMRSGYQYFAVSCTDGSLYLGQLTSDLSQSQITKVRQFNRPYHALYLDPKRNLLLGFPTQPDKPNTSDAELVDSESFTVNGVLTDANNGNEVPDQFEGTRRAWQDLGQRQDYQFFVYDIAAESNNAPDCPVGSTCNFPYRVVTDPLPQGELRWIYFRLNNWDGSPDQPPYFDLPAYKYYYTNFYATRPDPDDPDAFYLSQRGSPDKSSFSNQVIKVKIVGDMHATKAASGIYTFPTTPSELSFTRVYGFKGAEANKFDYTGDFRVLEIAGKKTILVNNFRDLVNWFRSDAYFSIGAKVLGDNTWFAEQQGQLSPANDIRSYFRIAVNSSGRLATCSFYGNQVVFMDVIPGVSLNIANQLR